MKKNIPGIKFLALVILVLFTHLNCPKFDENEFIATESIIADFWMYPETGATDIIFEFDASNSEFLHGSDSLLIYNWDWEGDGIYDTHYCPDPRISHQYTSAGSYNVTLTASIGDGHEHSNTCIKNLIITPASGGLWPTVTTSEISDVTTHTATCGGMITDEGTSPVTSRGICWSHLVKYPTLFDSSTNDGNGTGAFTSSLSKLISDTVYHVRAYAVNDVGPAYGEPVSFRTEHPGGDPCPGTPTISWQGHTYNTVKIGDQCWMKENLNWDIEDGNSWCYNHNPANCGVYGRLYDWETMMNGEVGSNSVPSGVQGICPEGWHLPSDNEWKILEGVVDRKYPVGDHVWDTEGSRGFNAGEVLMTKIGWGYNLDEGGTNLYNFSAKPGGYYHNSYFNSLTSDGSFWTCTENSNLGAYLRQLSINTIKSRRHSEYKVKGYSVRCIKD